jgi:hypothetical protein
MQRACRDRRSGRVEWEDGVPRYFLHQRRKDELIEDSEGAEFADLEQLKRELVLAAREIMTDRLMAGRSIDDTAFEVMDEAGRVVLKMPFQQALPGEGDRP